MKVLQVNVVYANGSTGKIVYDIHKNLLNLGIESIVCYGRGKFYNQKNVYKIAYDIPSKVRAFISKISGIHYNKCLFSTSKLLNIINHEKPDVIHLHCINGYFVNIYSLIKFLKKKNIPTLLTLHADFMFTGSCGIAYNCDKWIKGCGKCPNLKEIIKTPCVDNTHKAWKQLCNAYKGMDNIIVSSVSPWLMNRAKISMLKDKKHTVVMNGVDTNVFKKYDNFDNNIKKYFNKKTILFVTASFFIKIFFYIIVKIIIFFKNIRIYTIHNYSMFFVF